MAEFRQARPRRFARARGTTYDRDAALEQKAKQGIVGSLEERIFYKALEDRWFIPEVDFTFQAAQQGGRAELGGLVADFLFPVPSVIVQIQSDWHEGDLEILERDRTQQSVLESLGYDVLYIWPETLHHEVLLDQWFDRIARLWGV